MLNLTKIMLGIVAGVLVVGALAKNGVATPSAADPMFSAAKPARLAARSVLVAVDRAGERLVAVGERGHILLSDDQGQNWRQVSVPVSVTLTAVNFIDSKLGWAVGHSGVILHSADGGEHWTRQLDGQQSIKLLGESTSTDGEIQQRITRLQQDGPDKPFLDVHFSDANNGLAVGAYGLAFSTTDGGAHWKPALDLIPNANERHLYVIHARQEALYIAGEQGQVWRRASGDKKFEELTTPFKSTVFDLLSSPDGALLALGLGGKIHRSTDQGRSWQNSESPNTSTLTAGVLLKGSVLLASENGQILSSHDDGKSFQTVSLQPFPSAGLAVGKHGQLLAVGPLGTQILPLPNSQTTN